MRLKVAAIFTVYTPASVESVVCVDYIILPLASTVILELNGGDEPAVHPNTQIKA